MDAVHLMRSYTGRALIIKVGGGYRGHPDSVQGWGMPDEDEAGPRDNPSQVPSSTGIPEAITSLTLIAQFNDLYANVAGHSSTRTGAQIAGMIVQAVMMNSRHHPPAARLPVQKPQGPPALPRRAADVR